MPGNRRSRARWWQLNVDWPTLFTAFFGALIVALPSILTVWYKAKQHAAELAENTRLTAEIHEATVPDIKERVMEHEAKQAIVDQPREVK
jgi:hypothetical protein